MARRKKTPVEQSLDLDLLELNEPAPMGKSSGVRHEKPSPAEEVRRRKALRFLLAQEEAPEVIAAVMAKNFSMTESSVANLIADVQREDDLREPERQKRSRSHQITRVRRLVEKAVASKQFNAAMKGEELLAEIDGNKQVGKITVEATLNVALLQVIGDLSPERAREIIAERREKISLGESRLLAG